MKPGYKEITLTGNISTKKSEHSSLGWGFISWAHACAVNTLVSDILDVHFLGNLLCEASQLKIVDIAEGGETGSESKQSN